MRRSILSNSSAIAPTVGTRPQTAPPAGTAPAPTRTTPAPTIAPNSERSTLDPLARNAALGLLVVFVLAIVIMVALRADQHWDRLVFLFGGLEAIVFAAAGALFGTTVQRGAVKAARAEADQARDETNQAREDASSMAEAATKGKALGAAVKGAGSVGSATKDERLGARADESLDFPAAGDPTLRVLVRLADELFPDEAGI